MLVVSNGKQYTFFFRVQIGGRARKPDLGRSAAGCDGTAVCALERYARAVQETPGHAGPVLSLGTEERS